MNLKKIFQNETFSYLFYGVLTTLVNYVSFWLCLKALGYGLVLVANTVSFVLATAFAFVTNKLFVFRSGSWKWKVLVKEALLFLSSRLVSYLLEQAGLWLSTDVWHFERYLLLGVDGVMIAKVILSFLVVLINWAISKFLIFTKKR